jgi:putative SOS response-associated peptidase YedK
MPSRVRTAGQWCSLGCGKTKWPDGTVTRAFAMVPTNANETVGELHDRMPLILEPQD